MERFKQRLHVRTVWMGIIIIVTGIITMSLLINRNKLPVIPDFISGFQLGGFIALELKLIFNVIRNLTSMKKDETLKKLYISETDERRLMIIQKTGSIGIQICLIGLLFATVIAGFFNGIIFFSLLGAVIYVELVMLSLKAFYYNKFKGR